MQEEERDDEWETSESESADEPDTDFDESVRYPVLPCMWPNALLVCAESINPSELWIHRLQEDEGDDEEKDGEPKEHRQAGHHSRTVSPCN